MRCDRAYMGTVRNHSIALQHLAAQQPARTPVCNDGILGGELSRPRQCREDALWDRGGDAGAAGAGHDCSIRRYCALLRCDALS